MYSITMKTQDYNTENTITAVAMVLSKEALSSNKTIRLKVFLGQKSSLITDNNKFSLAEIIPMNAAGKLAVMISENISTNDQIKFTAKIGDKNNLEILGIEKQNNG